MTNIAYHGKVNIKLANTVGKIVWQASYTNNGTNILFDFLKLCLIGDYKTAENFRPLKIAFGHNNDADSAIAPAEADYTHFVPKTIGIVINTAAAIIDNAVTLHFVVPYTAFIKESEDTDTIQQISLFPANSEVNNPKNIAAYIFLTKDDGTWQPLDLSAMNENYSYIVEWKLTFSNDQTVDNN